MTLLAQEWGAYFEQRWRSGAVRVVAKRAVLRDRLVVPQERAAVLHVACVASLVDAVFDHQLGAGGAMRVVAVCTNHFAFRYGVMTGLFKLGLLFFVTGHAGVRHFLACGGAVVGNVHLMAVSAVGVTTRVNAAVPVHQFAAFMAGHTGLVVGNRVVGSHFFAVGQIWQRADFTLLLQVLLAIAVAAHTGGCALVGLGAVLGAGDGQNRVVLYLVTIDIAMATGAAGVTLHHEVLDDSFFDWGVIGGEGASCADGQQQHAGQCRAHRL